MKAKAKRLDPRIEVIKELFVKSGNECAFPGCTHRIINSDGVLIGQICHIEAAEKGGQRFNDDMSNEDRRRFSNLMLMCHAHHKITDDVTKYSVQALQTMKADHEAKYTLAPEKLIKAIVDEARHSIATPAKTLKRMDAVMGWNYEEYQFAPTLADLTDLLGRLRQVPTRTRQLLVAIVERTRKTDSQSRSSTVSHSEIATACSLESHDLANQLTILKQYGIVQCDRSLIDYSEEIQLQTLSGPWDFWSELKEYCTATGHSLDEFIIDLRFNLLD